MLQEVTVPSFSLNLQDVIIWVIIGLIAGILASALVRGRRYSIIGSLIVGLIGALVGGFLFRAFGFRPPVTITLDGIVWEIVVAFFGAIAVLFVFGLLYGFRRRL